MKNIFTFLSVVLCLFPVSGFAAADPDPGIKTLQPGVRVTLIAEHPALVTPTGIDVDDQGRVWVASCHTHFRPNDYKGPPKDEILVFSDRDGDGRAEARQVFHAGTVATMDLELGLNGWVYLAERSRILRVRDTDGDGRADVEENIATMKTEADYPHNGLCGLFWHPGGDLVFGLGENFAKAWTLTGSDGSVVQGSGEGGIFRCSPDGANLRRIARGFWNPFAICMRPDGEMFAADNDPGERPPCRLLHIVEGGDYGYQRLYGPAAHHPFVCWDGELRGTLPMLHASGEAPCGLQPLAGGLLGLTWSDHRVDFYPLRRKGASFETVRVPIVSGSRDFRPVCLSRGRLKGRTLTFHFTDWVKVNYQLHGHGRIWKMEIDLDQSKAWLDTTPGQSNDEILQARALRDGKHDHSRARLLKLAADDDVFLAQAALLALSGKALEWSPQEVRRLSAVDRVSALLALKLAGERRVPDVDAPRWVRFFLQDTHPQVRFETLRWIADVQMKEFLPDVERMLRKGDPDFRLFESVTAAFNTLSGKGAKGVRDTELLLGLVKNKSAHPQVRAHALRLLPAMPRAAPKQGVEPSLQFPKGLTTGLLRELLDGGHDSLSAEVVRVLAGNPAVGQSLLARFARDAEKGDALRAEAVAGLSAVAGDHIPLLLELAGNRHQSIRVEALRNLRQARLSDSQARKLQQVAAKHPDSSGLVRAILEPGSLVDGRPPLSDTEAWLKKLDAVPGPADPVAGRRIFHHSRVAMCSRCHRHEGRGNVVGPDLGALGGNPDRRRLLEAILSPNLEVSPQYMPRTLTFKNGTTFTGFHLRTGGRTEMVTLRDGNGQNRRFNRDEIVSVQELQVSLMPTGLPLTLTDRELRDLLAFLELKKGDGNQ